MHRLTYWTVLFVCLVLTGRGLAGQAAVSVALDPPATAAGGSSTLLIYFDVNDGFHAQSHTPSDESYIPLLVKTNLTAGVEFGEIQYPPGKNEAYPNLGTLNVYTGRVTIRVPVKVKPDAAGPLQISGTVRYQACDDNACFAPEKVRFSAYLNLAAAGGPATKPAATAPATAPTTAPAASATPPAGDDLPPAEPRAFGFALASDAYALTFGVAFLVGILFNAVPCVLPVVPLKIMGFYEASRHDRRKCFLLGVAFSAGLIASFTALAVLVVGVRSMSWGGLFQSTTFTVVIVAVLLVMAASQFGLFTFNLPTAAYGIEVKHDTYLGNVLFGVLTAALSTPCTIGPFSGLLAWALLKPPAIGAMTVVVVGCGMAFPYLLLSAFPQVVRRFPRTGPVGEIIKQTMAFLVLATAFYFARPFLNSVLTPPAFWWLLLAIIVAGAIFMVVRTASAVGTTRANTVSGVAAVLVVGLALLATLRLARDPHDWKPYTDNALADATAAGRPVLIDFTADWCGNCHYLEAFVLNDPKVVQALRAAKVVMLKADVTHGNEPAVPLKDKLVPTGEIPLTAFYRPQAPDPVTLKGVYSAADLLTAMRQPGPQS